MTVETWKPARSSQIAEAEYDSDDNSLVITFASGGRYRYHNVPRGTFDGLKGAESAGSYWNSVKNGFAYQRI